ncbi:MAG: hypothetical protein ACR2NH_02865 [Solirubrobacteraceae bacterium]
MLSQVKNKTTAMLLIGLMTFAALMLWIGIPLGWLYIGSLLVDSSQPSMGPYMVVVVGIVATVVADAMLISRLNRYYQRVTQTDGHVRVRLPWMRSMRGERDSGRETTVLDVILIGSVALAALTAGLWFFLLAGSSLPGG